MLKGTMSRTLAVVIALSVLGLTACGNSDRDGSATDSTSNFTSSDGATDFTAAKAAAAEGRRTDVKLPMPSDPVTMSDHKLAIINIGMNTSFGPLIGKFLDSSAEASGWQYKQFDGQLDVSKISGLMIQAVQERYDVIFMMVTDMNSVAAATQQALDAGVTIVCISCVTTGKFEGKVIDIRGDFTDQGDRIAAALVATRGADTKVVRYTDPALNSVTPVTEAVVAGVKKYCPNCDAVTVDTLPAEELAQPGPPTWSAFLASNPPGSYTDAVAYASHAAEVMQPTLDQAGRTEIRISSTAATAEWIAAIKSSANENLATCEAVEYQAWAAVDLAARKMAGMTVWDATKLYSPLVDKSNADKFLPDGNYVPDGQDFTAEFKALWK